MKLPPGPIAAITQRGDAMAALLVRWAEINSGSANQAGLKRMADALVDEFARAFPAAQVERIPLGSGQNSLSPYALSIRLRPGARRQVLLSGHYDTVYDADHAFQTCTRISPNLLRGPGVADMKGGIVVLLEALRAFECLQSDPACAQPDPLGWQVLLTPDEETGSVLSEALLMETAKRHELALVFEPARPNGNLVRARMGTGIFTATCRGRAAHAGRDPQAGRNAIVALAEFLVEADAAAKSVEGALLNIGAIRGGGTVNIVPDFAAADLNLRVDGATAETELWSALNRAAFRINQREGYRLEFGGRMNRPPKAVTPADEKLFVAYRDCAAGLGLQVDWQDVAGGSDGNFLSAKGLPCLDGIGPIGDHLHSSEESVQLDSLVSRAQVAAVLLDRYSRGR
ncbi:MAG TPA: hydrolase [Opitutaceae bacterium]|jgi:glutamate carboxypeptidase